ncbi:hypothetical protein M3Y97_00409100 [Aphelenchoides bicaudatus]|nr:hypothetical protein M3Y97_00409100 [Aphelenchoides bicaudatus]
MHQGDQLEQQNQGSQFFYTSNIPPMYTQNSFPTLGQHIWPQQWAPTIQNLGLCVTNGNHSLNDSGFSSMHRSFNGSFVSNQQSFQTPVTPNAGLIESPVPKSKEYDADTQFQIPGRLGLLNSNKTYTIGMNEIKRRLGSPEKLNTSYINGIVRKAKGRAAGQKLREKLQKNNLHVEHGRRTNVKTTCFLPLCEEEAMSVSKDFEFLLGKFMPRTQLKQALRSAVKNNLKTLRNDVGELRKSIQKQENTTSMLMHLFQFFPTELARIFDEDETLKIQQENQSGTHPKRNADIQFSTPLQQELWNLNLMSQLPVKVVVGPRLTVEREAVFMLLKELASENLEFFETNSANTTYHPRIAECCSEIGCSASLMSELVPKIQVAAQKCDFDEDTPGNGFRSLICLCDTAILHLVSIFKECTDTRDASSFRAAGICKDVENYVAILRFLVLAFQQTVLLIESLDEGSLFPSLEGDYSIHDGFFKGLESLDASCFYGRAFGFQFVPSVTLIFNVVGIFLANYSLSWGSCSTAIGSLFDSGRYLLSPEQRAKQIIKVTREADIEFCRGFWNLSELPPPRLFCPSMNVYITSSIPMCGPQTLESKKSGVLIEIPEPTAHGPPAAIPVRVFSSKNREGLTNKGKQEPLSPNLVIHCHGGGYVATTSKSHETYLRVWANYLDCTIISIDYSLSPEFPYPRPTEEVLYAYAWILKNAKKFGWSGKKVVMVGDSAGGNLIVSLSLRLIELNAKRMPDALVPIYTPFLFQYLPAPSRVLSFADPLLHMGVVIRCAAAYTNACPEGTETEIRDQDKRANRKSLSRYIDEIKSKNLVEENDCNIECSFVESFASLSVQETNDDEEKQEVKKAIQESKIQAEEQNQHDETIINIDQDSAYISLSACHYNPSLFEYLKSHPLTASSTFLDGECQVEEDVFDSDEVLCEFPIDKDGQFKYKARCVAQRITFSGDSLPAPSQTKPSMFRNIIRSLTTSVTNVFEGIAHYLSANSAPVGHDDRAKLAHSAKVGFREAALTERQNAEGLESVLVELMKLNLPREHLISPMYTKDEVLKQLPPFHFVALHLDPLLDDTISFAKKLRAAGGRISSMDLLHGLPHGFLNFALISDDCYEGARICMRRIEEALNAK